MILTVNGESGELQSGAGELKVFGTGGGGERGGLLDGGQGDGNDVGAVDEVRAVVAEDGELVEGGPEAVGHELLLVDEALPEAGGALVAGQDEVGLETELAGVGARARGQGRGDLTGVVFGAGEEGALEQDLEEDLGVEGERGLRGRVSVGWFRY